jgi:hypothetical protein
MCTQHSLVYDFGMLHMLYDWLVNSALENYCYSHVPVEEEEEEEEEEEWKRVGKKKQLVLYGLLIWMCMHVTYVDTVKVIEKAM